MSTKERVRKRVRTDFGKIYEFVDSRFNKLALFPGWLLVVLALSGSLSILILYSFLENVPPAGTYEFTFNNYSRLFDPTYLSFFTTSLWNAFVVTIVCLLLAYPVSYYLARTDWRYRNVVIIAILAPLWVNIVIKAYAWQLILGETGLINYVLVDTVGIWNTPRNYMFSHTATIIGLVHILFPFAVLPLYTAMRRLDDSQIEAVKNLGGNRVVAFFAVVLPQTLSALAASAVFVFILAFGALPTPEILGGRQNAMVGNIMTSMFQEFDDWGLGAAMAVLFTIIVIAIVALVSRYFALGSAFYGSDNGEESSSNKNNIPLPRRLIAVFNFVRISDRIAWFSLKGFTALTLVFIYLPIFVVILLSFSPDTFPQFPIDGISLQWYQELIPPDHNENLIGAFITSLELGVMAAVGAAVLGTLAVLGMARSTFTNRFFQQDVLTITFLLPMIVPWIVLGIAMLTLFSLFGIQGTFISLLIGHIFLTLPFVFTVVAAQYETVDTELEEAAKDLGANRLQTLRYVTLPLLTPGIIAGALFAFSVSFDNFTQSFFWSGPDTTTLPIVIFTQIRFGVEPSINAIGTVIIVISLVSAVIGERIANRY